MKYGLFFLENENVIGMSYFYKGEIHEKINSILCSTWYHVPYVG